MKRFLISAAHKSSGKTTVSIGLSATLSRENYKVQTFKKGPDYIDPMWLGRASGRPCYNLDFYLSTDEEIRQEFAARSDGSDIAIIEGNKGLYDGLALDGSNSNAALAKLLKTPVILVVDTRGITRGVAPLLKGYNDFDDDITIAGVILNQVGGSRHESKLRAAVEYYTDIPVLGAIARNEQISIDERHLGLIPSYETDEAQRLVDACALAIKEGVDFDKLLSIQADSIADATPIVPAPMQNPAGDKSDRVGIGVRIGIAKDAAFGFYYQADLEAMAQAGAELVPINMLTDTSLPEIDGLFIGGGFPETHINELAKNSSMRTSIHDAIESGLPTYAECGGMMYLTNSITWGDNSGEMVGIIPGDITMHDHPVGRGYTRLQETSDHPWADPDTETGIIEFPAHEFHYSSLENLSENLPKNLKKNPTYAYKVLRGTGINGENDGYVYKNLLASYVHLRNVPGNQWVSRFIRVVRRHKSQ